MTLLQRVEHSLPRVPLAVLDERTNPTGYVLDDIEWESYISPLDDVEDDVEDEDVDIGTCSTCGDYGTPGRECRKPTCLELGGTFC